MRPVILLNLSEVEKAYIAGIFDGEGCICLANEGHKGRRRYHRPFLHATNTDKNLMEWLKIRIPYGFISFGKRHNPNWKDVYIFQVSYRACPVLLREILPYLVLKRKQAELLLEYCVNHKWGKHTDREHEIFQELKKLNARGTQSTVPFAETDPPNL